MAERVKVTIPPLGKPVIDAEGFVGVSCKTATEGLEKALAGRSGGLTVVEKPEMNQVRHDQEEQAYESHY